MPVTFPSQLSSVSFVRRAEPVLRRIVALASFVLGSVCTSLQSQDLARSHSSFELIRFFTGHSRSWGVFETSHGQPRRYFTCDSYGKHSTPDDLTLCQHFLFSDGKTQNRVWQIHQVDSSHWQASADDMIGVAQAVSFGNTASLEYTITLDRQKPMATVHIRQWIYQPEESGSLMTRLVITKLGVTIFQVSEVIHHVSSDSGLRHHSQARP
jgi:Protein of unknown function (DUF3833)